MKKRRFSGFAFFFLAEILRPLQLPRISAEAQRALLAFSRAEPENRPVVLDVHHACASWEISSAKRAFSRFRHSLQLRIFLSGDLLCFAFCFSEHQDVLNSDWTFNVSGYNASFVSSFENAHPNLGDFASYACAPYDLDNF